MRDPNTYPTGVTKMYVIVRQDMPPGLQMAQAIHAAVDEALLFPKKVRKHPTVVVLHAEDEAHLIRLAREGVTVFREPDQDDAITAIATFSKGEEFADLPLALEVKV